MEGTIKLVAFLKLSGAAESGGHASHMVRAGEVQVNGEVETRRGRQLRPGDVVSAAGEELRVEEYL